MQRLSRSRNRLIFEYLFVGLFFVWITILIGWQKLLPHFRLVNAVIIFCVLVFLFLRKKFPAVLFSRFGLLFTMYLSWQSISLLWTPLPWHAIDGLNLSFLFLITFLFLSSYIQSIEQLDIWENGLIGLTLVIVLLALPEVWHWYRNWWLEWGSFPPVNHRLYSTILGHPNVLAGFINLSLPLLIVRWFHSRKTIVRIAVSALLILFGFALYMASSRGGWVSGFAGVAVTMILLFGSRILDSLRKIAFHQLLNLRNSLIFIFLVTVSSLLGFLLFKNYQMTPGHGGRMGIWVNSWNVWQERFLTGRGVDSFILLYAHNAQLPPGFMAEHAHNLILQIGAEFGLVGLFLLVGMIVVLLWEWLRTRWNVLQPVQNDRMAAYAGVFVIVFLHQLIDFLFFSPLYTMAVLLFVVWLETIDQRGQKQICRKKCGNIVFIVTLFGYVGSIWFSVQGMNGHLDGIQRVWAGDWVAAHERLCSLADRYPQKTSYGFQCGLAGLKVFSETNGQDVLVTSLYAQRAAIQHDPYWPVHWANLAMLEWYSGNLQAGMNDMSKAIDLAPRYAIFWANLGWMKEAQAQTADAIWSYQKAFDANPWLQISPYFQESSWRIEALNGWEPEIEKWKVLRAYSSYQDGEIATAERILLEKLEDAWLDGDAHALWGVLLQEKGDAHGAWKHVQIALLLDSSPRVLGWAAHVARLQGKEELAANYLQDAFRQLAQGIRTRGYVALVYHHLALPFDQAPQLIRPDITPELVADFKWLDEYYQRNGSQVKAEEIQTWLNLSFDVK
jgi:O-antigen ligase/tetratricopeptide (TPR) repeat protein